jgi:L-ascorbate metabolism protein UlaG (beta-lactamase superfamily)
MTEIQRLSDSCVLVTTDDEATLFDPGFHTFTSGDIDIDGIGDVTRVLITHEHGDHVSPDFIGWLVERRADLQIFSNEAVRGRLAKHDFDVRIDLPDGVSSEDVPHEIVPNGASPPNRSFTIDGLFTHPGDSRQATTSAPVLASPLMAPWGSMTGAVEFVRRLAPQTVVPVHDFYLSKGGREWVTNTVRSVLEVDGIEVVPLDWGESFTV